MKNKPTALVLCKAQKKSVIAKNEQFCSQSARRSKAVTVRLPRYSGPPAPCDGPPPIAMLTKAFCTYKKVVTLRLSGHTLSGHSRDSEYKFTSYNGALIVMQITHGNYGIYSIWSAIVDSLGTV